MIPKFNTVAELHAWSMANPTIYCCHEAKGRLHFDPGKGTKHFDPNWALLVVEPGNGIQEYYAHWLKRYVGEVMLSKLWGTHVSVIKGHIDTPTNLENWGKDFGEIPFRYAHTVRFDHEKHAWVDVYSPRLSEIRQSFGLPAKEWFHLTIGRFR